MLLLETSEFLENAGEEKVLPLYLSVKRPYFRQLQFGGCTMYGY